MAHQFRARLANVRATPSRSEDANNVIRVLFEAHDTPVDPLVGLLDRQVYITLESVPPTRTPLENAIEAAGSNGAGSAAEVEDTEDDSTVVSSSTVVPSAGRRRRGTKANVTEDE